MNRHPCCLRCYQDRSEGRAPVPLTEGLPERCCFCGTETDAGVWSSSREQPPHCTEQGGDHGE